MWVNDRFDEGRRVVELGLKDGRKLLDRAARDGSTVFIQALDEGRKVFDSRLRDGRDVLDHSLRDGRKQLDRSVRDGRKLFDERYGDGRKFVEARLSDSRKALAPAPAPSAAAVLWPTLIAAAGAGAAIWWWTQWSRGKAEAEARAALDKREGGGEVPIDHPEMVMAHHNPPPGGPINSVDKADEKLVEPAEQLMMHAPVDETTVAPVKDRTSPKAKKPGKAEALASVASKALASAPKALEETLGVQGAASAPRAASRPAPSGGNGVKAPPRSRKGGPTIM